jgi:hypothetical protein
MACLILSTLAARSGEVFFLVIASPLRVNLSCRKKNNLSKKNQLPDTALQYEEQYSKGG